MEPKVSDYRSPTFARVTDSPFSFLAGSDFRPSVSLDDISKISVTDWILALAILVEWLRVDREITCGNDDFQNSLTVQPQPLWDLI